MLYERCSRPICLYYSTQPYTPLFFISYEFMSSIIMLNVVVAILLERFITAETEVKEESKMKRRTLSELLLTDALQTTQPAINQQASCLV